MIFVQRFDGKKIVLNGELIEMIETTPDTIITMTTGKKITVKDSVDEIVSMVKKYKKEIYLPIINNKNEN
ncbi:MAG: Flagellar protein (FlbD) [Candidatus Aerophobetes bacterium ADurb.Bin490]|nr:MAG: Flagellar protein (FlbD) [Candidatus Aerophobetes bacterium ADurb.Bin490]HNZ28656.1 flagellar FlbD family protein [Candidatus Goldiibacteriota bacterium]HPI03524.1 flagellar FlbD family protein [Candidatus Goldiibacteriota bacterium]HPN65527.1 flagellar FlbD family protein [Candidatus Goldiibacteriota bacterium]HRQ43920.1 flagellar FlbD family protein [Candidatus Goldiibacteriota bacterium]